MVLGQCNRNWAGAFPLLLGSSFTVIYLMEISSLIPLPHWVNADDSIFLVTRADGEHVSQEKRSDRTLAQGTSLIFVQVQSWTAASQLPAQLWFHRPGQWEASLEHGPPENSHMPCLSVKLPGWHWTGRSLLTGRPGESHNLLEPQFIICKMLSPPAGCFGRFRR